MYMTASDDNDERAFALCAFRQITEQHQRR